uniref:Afadin n=1 Tax=Anopheles culicifacies TaxID=139723 RepID=A0A182MPI8_9DIPT
MGGKMPTGSNAVGGSFLDGPVASTSADSAASQPQSNAFAKTPSFDMQSTAGAQQSQQTHPPHMHLHHHHHPSGLLVTALDGPDAMGTDDTASYKGGHTGNNDHNESEQQQQQHHAGGGQFGAGNGGETETKSISSFKSIGSTTDSRTSTFPKLQPSHAATSISGEPGGQEPILPAVLEFPEQNQEPFLQSVISELDVNSPNFKLAPVYTLYLCARYRASTHYRPDLQPTERAHKLTVFLHHVANLIQNVVQEQYTDAKILSFWMANSSEFLHFLKSDRHISAFSVQAQEVLAESVQTAFRNLVSIFHVELSQTLNQFLSENIDHDSAAGLVLSVLGSAMALLRRCRVNAALTIQLFSQLFHYINVVCFNKFVTTSHMCTSAWGKALSERLSLLELWAEKQGLELAADCHLAKINQCAQFLQAPKTSVSDVQQLACSCFRLNSLQMAALLSQETIPRNLIDTAVRMAESVADELSRADGREIRLEESPELPLALLLPDDGFSCDVVRGIPAGLVDFLNPFQMAGWCRLASQPTSIGLWTVYMHQFNHGRSPSVMSSKLPQPEVQIIKLHKNANGMGLSIVAAKGAGQERLGIYIKSVVGGGAADLDGRLQAGDQLLEVDGQSLIGITQERAADHLVRTGPIVTLKVAKQGAIYHGLATLLQQPSPVIQREMENEFNCNVYDNDGNHRYHFGRSNESLNFYGSGGGSHQSRRGSLRRPLSSVMMNHTYSTPYLTQNDAAYRRMSNPDISQRRYSLSLSHEDILSNDQLQQIHFDPRYRDCRSSNSLNSIYYNQQRTRSNSLNSIGRIGTIMKPVRYDTPPSIYVEDYDSRSNSHSSREMIKIEETAEPETPVVEERRPSCVFEIRIEAPSTESNLSFVADVNLDDIPFIDEDDADEEEAPGSRSRGTGDSGTNVSTQTTPAVVVNSPSTVTISDAAGGGAPNHNYNSNIGTTGGGNLPSIMINTASRRGSNASCRKTVSFDIINDHHPYDDSDEEERAKGKPYNGQGNVENVASDVNSDTFSTAVPLTSRVSNRLNNNQIVVDNSGTSYAVRSETSAIQSTYPANQTLSGGMFSAQGSHGGITCDMESNNNGQHGGGDDPPKSIANAGEPRAQERPIDTIREYVVRHFSGTANVNVNNNYYCSNTTVDRRQRNIQLDSEETRSIVCPQDALKGAMPVDNRMGTHFVTDSNNAPSATLDNDHCNLLRNIQLLKADGAFVGAAHSGDSGSGTNDPHQRQHHHLHPGQGGAKVSIPSPSMSQAVYDSSPYSDNSPTVADTCQPEETVKFGHGKVKALAKFYNSLKDTNNNVIKYSKPRGGSNPPRQQQSQRKECAQLSSTSARSPTTNRLSTDEEQQIVNQLKLWSEFGSDGEELALSQMDVSLKRSQSYDTSLNGSICAEPDKAASCRNSYDRLDSGKISHDIKRSPNLNHLHPAHHGLHPHTLPTGFLLRKIKMCSPSCKNIENQKVTLNFLYGRSSAPEYEHRSSCPDLSNVRQTPRQLKKQHNILRLLKQINNKLSDASDGEDTPANDEESGRRMSERDMTRVGTSSGDISKPPVPSTAAGQQLLNSKSVPALHHVGNIGASANKSRSIHNLAGGGVGGGSAGTIGTSGTSQDQGFYQNLSVYRAQNQSHPNLGERYVMLGNNGNVNGFMRDAQAQQSLRMNQMMAPSMPNIAHSVAGSGYPAPGVISASQSMQNVNVIPGGPGSPAGGYNYHGSANGSPMLSPQMYPHDGQQQLGPQHHSSLLRGQAKLAEMNELIKRRQQQQQQPVSYNTATTNKPPQQQPQQGPNATMPPSTAPKPMRAQDDQPPLPPASTHPMFKPGSGGPAQLNNNAYSSADPPKVGFYPTMPSQSKNLPQAGSSPWEREEKEKESELRREHVRAWRDQQIVELQSLPQRTPKQEEQLRTLILERDFERRAMEEDQDYDNDMPPYGAKEHGNVQEVVRLTQPNAGSLTAPMTKLKQLNLSEITANNTNANQMMSQMVHDMNQMNLSSSMPGATPSAVMMGEDRENSEYGHPMTHEQQTLLNGGGGMNPYMLGGDANNGNGGVPPPPPPERNSSYVIMSQQQQKLRTSTAPTKLSFSGPTTSSPALDLQQQQQNAMNNNVNTMGGRYSNNNLLMTAPNNGQLNNNQSTPMGGANSVTAGNASLLSNSYKDNKRVSFHDEDAGNNNTPMMAPGPAGYTQAGHLIGGTIGNETTGGSGELGTILERPDPDRFIDETMPAMLHTPTTPDGENWNMQIQATPGVIGAQEVYRDPRTRRLAEQQQKQKSEAVPEKLSFKEKMKMFALESGENNTPKDKLKISRAQRDIDAVH